MSAGVLNSWKEIAVYTGRGVRTIQRWERELGFPIRRPREKNRSAVVAIKAEIDLWFRMPHRQANRNPRRDRYFETQTRLLRNAEVLQARTSRLVDCCDVLKREIDRALKIGEALEISCQTRRTRRMSAGLSGTEQRANLDVLHRGTVRAATLVTALQTSLTGRDGKSLS